MKTCCIILSLLLTLGILFLLWFGNKKETIYIRIENISGYEYLFGTINHSKKIVLRPLGRFSYQYWDLEVNTTKIEAIGYEAIEKFDVVSQYWIINNMNGFQIGFDYEKLKKYKLQVIRFENDKLWIYPISQVHFIIE
ncbi:hypothetical protein [Maribellus sediminis]|uniref:hypothetical protein n=1 Tax=Maribellus sediminis TaxID=2696285 RepID=UPI001430B61F|nr:hypothetical protein [Maribellus sediminis]